MMVGLWTLLLLAGWCAPPATGLSCAPCGDTACPQVTCPGGTVLDACGCCRVCARTEGDRCGGYFEALGRCADGLVCKSRPRPGQLIGGAIEGICTRDDAISCQYCQLMLDQCVCSEVENCDLPDVSADPTSFTSRRECEVAALRAGQATIPPTAGVASCPGVTCETSVPSEIGCPSDSVLKQTRSARPDCCRPFSECICDLESCPSVAKCPRGQKVKLVAAGQRVPGQCCSKWTCRPAEMHLEAYAKAEAVQARPALAEPILGNPILMDGILAEPIPTSTGSTDRLSVSNLSNTPASEPKLANPIPFSETSSEPITASEPISDHTTISEPMTSSEVPTADVSSRIGTDPCFNITCPPAELCPGDSYRLPSQQDPIHCCQGACQCLPDQCRPPTCVEGQRLKVMSSGSGRPGSCCTVYQCDTAPTCTHSGRTHRDGDVWKSDECTTCHCKNALTFCQPVQCPPLKGCSRVTHDREQCCPRCLDGCVSPSGVFHNSSEQWLENDCTTCSCTGDKLHCHTETCRITCEKTHSVPGRCCPVCDESECAVVCRHGYRTDAGGDPLCECLSAEEVARDPPRCRSMAECRRRCPHGFKRDPNGCDRCKCRRCRKLRNCSLTCPLELNARGCPMCRCQMEYHTEVSPVTTSFSPTSAETAASSCVSADESIHADGASWHDGCRECYCQAGTEMCTFISCPVPACQHPEIQPGHCCPTCPDSSSPAPRHLNSSVCQSIDGATYLDGQSWHLDTCTHCLCQTGRVLCTSPDCPPAACARPQRHLSGCCATCPLDSSPIARGRPCRTENGELKHSGEAWKVGTCRSCRCLDGKTRCFHEKCPQVECERPLLKKGQCCPQCIEPVRASNSCQYQSRSLSSGEHLVVDPCTTCTCRAGGQLVCARKVCSPGCDNPTPVQGQCCPVCSVTSPSRRNYLFLNGTSKATHRTRVPQPERPTQTSRPGVQPGTGGTFTSPWQYVLCGLLALLLVLMILTACCCLYWHRKRSGYTPKQETADEKKPLNGGPNSFDCSHLNNIAVLQNKRVHGEKNANISIIRDT